ncbi:MAG: ATP-binding cassette domain-containing protein [Firmicutes bacterium]|nr:ATP-binding cassette domain-containing protein [Bacillota bacterium]MCL1953413.1 ATP-binding cassette domain-containing protein [Bacillota bacterium]
MISVQNISLQYGSRILFKDVNIKFTAGNCYGVIGANGAGKSTFLKILSGELQPNTGEVVIEKNKRMSVLNQDQNAFDNYTVLNTVMQGHNRLVEIIAAKEILYAKPDFNDEDGKILGDLESEFEELDGWNAESNAEQLLNSLKVDKSLYESQMSLLEPKVKVKVLLAQALFGNPDILILDEPTNNLDIKSVAWLQDYLMELDSTVITVSHNRHFLNQVCTHMCDVDFRAINIFAGNYDFWYETSQLILRQQKDQNKKAETRAKELQDFIARFSANASKSRQATSRKKELEKLKIEDIKPSNRRYPFIEFKYEREPGNDILTVENLTKKGYFENLSFSVKKGDKIALLGDRATAISMFFDILMGIESADSGEFKFGKTIIPTYLPLNNNEFFDNCTLNLVQWIGQYSKDNHQEFLRGWLGRMLFSGEEALKQAQVLSGGEKVRCMFARMMLQQGNFLIMDEPTNHLDLESITALNKGLQSFKGTLLFVSHDHELVNTVASRIIELKSGKKVFDRDLSYDEYLETQLL